MRKVLAVTAGVIALLMMLASCGGGGGSSKSSGSKGKSSEFSSLYDKRNNAKIKVTYQSTDENGSTGKEFTIAQDGPDKTAYIDKDSEVIVNGQTVTSCSNLDSEPTCNEVPGGPDAAKALIAGFTGVLGAADAAIGGALAANEFGDTSSQTIAGRDATCWKFSAGNIGGIGGAIAKKLTGNASYEVCLDKSTGVQLRWKVGADGKSSSLEATKVEDPTDADFEAPASASTTTTEDSSGTSDTTDSGSTTETTACTPQTLPAGLTVPGVSLPCLNNG